MQMRWSRLQPGPAPPAVGAGWPSQRGSETAVKGRVANDRGSHAAPSAHWRRQAAKQDCRAICHWLIYDTRGGEPPSPGSTRFEPRRWQFFVDHGLPWGVVVSKVRQNRIMLLGERRDVV